MLASKHTHAHHQPTPAFTFASMNSSDRSRAVSRSFSRDSRYRVDASIAWCEGLPIRSFRARLVARAKFDIITSDAHESLVL